MPPDFCGVILCIAEKEELYRKNYPSDRAFKAGVASNIEFYNILRSHPAHYKI